MITYYNSDKSKRAFYDPHCRTWTMLELDGKGNQKGDAIYQVSRSITFAWLATDVAKVNVIKSVYETNGEILDAIEALHCQSGFDCDLTYGHGAFWRDREKPTLRFDITPMVDGVEKACSTMLPIADGSLSNCVFDPPFLTYVKNAREHNKKVAMSSRYGGYYTYEELEDHYRHTISEAYRVLAHRGKLIFKCQDIVHNHKLHASHIRVVQMAEIEGFRLADTFILVAKNRMPSPQKGQQRHARIFHSYFLVLEKT